MVGSGFHLYYITRRESFFSFSSSQIEHKGFFVQKYKGFTNIIYLVLKLNSADLMRVYNKYVESEFDEICINS